MTTTKKKTTKKLSPAKARKLQSMREQLARVEANLAKWPDPAGDMPRESYENLISGLRRDIAQLESLEQQLKAR